MPDAVTATPVVGIDYVRLSDSYGITFEQIPAGLNKRFVESCERLVTSRIALAGSRWGEAITVPNANYLQLPAVLAVPLQPAQRQLVDDQETAAVADYCLSVQAEVARVPIEEDGERMVHLPTMFEAAGVRATYSHLPFHQACGAWAGKQREFSVRESFAHRLQLFGLLLNALELALHVEDAFRPVGVQEGLFARRMAWIREQHPDWTSAQMLDEARSKTAATPRLASHKAGAALDGRAADMHTGRPLDIGHDYPDGGAIVFPASPFVTADQWANRQLFQVAAGLSDLTLYVGEDWHVSYGDNLAALDASARVRPDYVARYGPIKGFARHSEGGRLLAVYGPDELDRTFATP